jgi:crotonobetainyl-CoA:carnitine CoA-transferase CaiB-like acyl-CoA transferase
MTSNTLDTPKVSAGFDINAQFRTVMHDLGLSPEDIGGSITFIGEDPIFPTVHRLGACIAIPIMAGAAGVANIWRQRSGRGQDLTLDLRKAIHGINPMYKFGPTINGYPYQLPYWINPNYQLDNPMGFDLYRTKDGRFFLPTGAYPGLLNNMCTFLHCGPDKDQIAEAVSKWNAADLDEAAADAGLVFAIVRTPEEWAAHPQGKQLAERPLVEIVKIADSDPEPFTPAARPLSGLRVLAATHVIAGNVMGRTLAEHGAEVLQIAHPDEFENEGLMQDPCAGFTSSAWLNLKQPEALRRAYELAADADVFVESYRPHKIANLGLSPEELAARRPGIICASAQCYSYDGPWANRGGFDMEALCVTGFTTEEGTPEQPKFPPTYVMNDLPRRGGHPGRADPPGQRRRQLPRAGQPGPLLDVVQLPGHLRQARPSAHRRAAPNPGPRHHHRPNSLRGVRPTGPAGAVLRNQALLARPGTGGARIKQAGLDNRLRPRATVTDHQES